MTESPALSPDAQAAADRALLREAMLRDQLEAWIEQRGTAPQGLSPDEIAALQRLRARGPVGGPGAAVETVCARMILGRPAGASSAPGASATTTGQGF